jgi:hypothetical protein
MEAARASGASNRWRSSPTVVVFPFVPVTPIMRSSRDGWPKAASAAMPAARRPSFTPSAGSAVRDSSSTIATAAPARAAASR